MIMLSDEFVIKIDPVRSEAATRDVGPSWQELRDMWDQGR